MKNLFCFLMFLMFFFISGCAASMTSSPREHSVSGGEMDLIFLKEPPYIKTKNRMDLSGIKKNEDLIVVREAVNQIARFFVQLSFVQAPIDGFSEIATKNGMANIKFPPKNNQYNYYLAIKIYNWVLHDPEMISLSAEFRGVPDKGSPYFDKFVFVKKDGIWLFDRREL